MDPSHVTRRGILLRKASAPLILVLLSAGSFSTPASLTAQVEEGSGSALEALRAEDRLSWLDWIEVLEVEENRSVINVVPDVFPDPLGGFLVVDSRESQLRRYADDGRLLWHFGRRGQGPREFLAAQVAGRLPSGEVFIGDRDEKLVVLDSAGGDIVRTLRTGLQRVENAVILDDSILIMGGMNFTGDPSARAFDGPRLHFVNIRTGAVTGGFFRPFEDYHEGIAAMAGSILVSARDSLVAAAALPKDSVFLHTNGGRLLRKFELPTRHFRVVEPLPASDFQNPEARADWLHSFDSVVSLHWSSDRILVVQYRSLRGTHPVWHTLGMSISGERLFEWRDSPRLLGVDPDRRLLIFQHPDSVTPNVWAIGRMSISG